MSLFMIIIVLLAFLLGNIAGHILTLKDLGMTESEYGRSARSAWGHLDDIDGLFVSWSEKRFGGRR